MKAIPTLKDHGYNRVEFAMSIRQWAEEAEQENNEITKQAAHWHEAYGKSEAENELLKQCREYDAGNAKRPDGYIVVDSETAKRIDEINN